MRSCQVQLSACIYMYIIMVIRPVVALQNDNAAGKQQRESTDWIGDQADVSLKKPKDGDITAGAEITLKCSVDGDPAPQIMWYKDTVRIREGDGYSFLDSTKLRIRDVSAVHHNGVYSCEAENRGGAAASTATFLLNITGSDTPVLEDGLFRKTTVTVVGGDVWLHCGFTNIQSVSWNKGLDLLTPIRNSTRSRTTVYPNGTLYIRSVERQHEGMYLCEGVATTGGMTQSFTADLQIAKLGRFNKDNLEPRFDGDPVKVIAQGGSFELNCLKPHGVPTPTVRWQYTSSGIPVQNGPKINVYGTKLIIRDADISLASNYTCVAENMGGIRKLSVEISVTVTPEIVEGPENTAVEEGTLAQLSCNYTGSKPPWTQVKWFFKDKPVEPKSDVTSGPITTVDHISGTLTIYRASTHMEGVYYCLVDTQQQVPVKSQHAFLNVIMVLKFHPAPRSMTFEVGSNQSIPCKAVAEVTPTIRWFHVANKKVREELPDQVTSSQAGELIFTNIQKAVAGDYLCQASLPSPSQLTPLLPANSTISTTISVEVGISPTITLKSDNQTVTVGDAAILHCEATGDPLPNVKWYQAGAILDLNSTSRMQQLMNNSLLIYSVRQTDEAMYVCMVGNKRGFKRAEMALTVLANFTTDSVEDNKKPQDFTSNIDREVEKAGIGMTKTIVIAVCSSVAYLALVIGLIVYCSVRMMRKRQQHRITRKANLQLHPMRKAEAAHETEKLMTPTASAANTYSPLPHSNGYTTHEHASLPRNCVVVEERSGASTPHLSLRKGFESNDSTMSKSSLQIVKYDRTKLVNIGVLGNGMFGDVFLAKAAGLSQTTSQATSDDQTELVCVKRLTNKDEGVQAEFRREMHMFHKLRHDRICRLLAVCREDDPIYMVMEYCEWGDLKQFLIATNGCNGGQELTIDPPTNSQKLTICYQVATAMTYLSSRRFLHKDLASRNVLLEPNLNVKVSSLGLAKDIYASEYVQARGQASGLLVPLRWTSPEAWLEEDYSTKSDVWSFGCFLYEVFSGGDIPYSNKTNEQVMSGYESGCLEPITGDCMPQAMQTIAYQCWSTCLTDRPDFSQIVTMFSSSKRNSNM